MNMETEILKIQKESTNVARAWAVIVHPTEHTRILLGRRSAKCNNPGMWGLFGGQVDEGETPRTAVARELFEETTIRWKSLRFNILCTEKRNGAENHWLQPIGLWEIGRAHV